MSRVLRIVLGVALFAIFVAWMVLRHYEPISSWVPESQIGRLAWWAGAWICGLAGLALIAGAWTRPEADEDEEPPGA